MMRLGLSHLRSHLYNYNLVNTPYCENEASGHVLETPSHFLLSCHRHSDKRHTMLPEITAIVFPGTNYKIISTLMSDYFCWVLLKGSEDLSLDANKKVFAYVFKFIDEYGRLNHNDDTDAHD